MIIPFSDVELVWYTLLALNPPALAFLVMWLPNIVSEQKSSGFIQETPVLKLKPIKGNLNYVSATLVT